MMSRAALQYSLSSVGAAASSVAGPFELVGAEHMNLALSGIHFGVWSGRGHCPEATTAATADDFTTNAFIALEHGSGRRLSLRPDSRRSIGSVSIVLHRRRRTIPKANTPFIRTSLNMPSEHWMCDTEQLDIQRTAS